MNQFIKIIPFVALLAFSCTKRNCVKTSDIAFADLGESDRDFYSFSRDDFSLDICQYITPNGDNVNDSFDIVTNLVKGDYLSTSFRVVNACEDIIHVERNTFPFTFPDPKTLEDGQYEFTLSVQLAESKKMISGSGIIRILRK